MNYMHKNDLSKNIEDWDQVCVVTVFLGKKEQAKFICNSFESSDRWIHLNKVYMLSGKNIIDEKVERFSSTFSEQETIDVKTLKKEDFLAKLDKNNI